MSEQSIERLQKLGAVLKKSTKGNILVADLTGIESHSALNELISELIRFDKLKELNLSGLPVTDELFAPLLQVHSIQTLDLSNTSITDRVLQQLHQFPKLKIVQLSGTEITTVALAAARKKMIDTRLVYR